MIFDFEGALKSGFEKGEIVDFLRKEAKSDINWQEIDELKAQAKKNNANLNENAFVFNYLQNGNFNFNSAPSKKEDTLALIKEKEKLHPAKTFMIPDTIKLPNTKKRKLYFLQKSPFMICPTP